MAITELKDRDPIAIDHDDRTVIIQHGRKIIRVRRTRESEGRQMRHANYMNAAPLTVVNEMYSLRQR